jgi:hypothetical protein
MLRQEGIENKLNAELVIYAESLGMSTSDMTKKAAKMLAKVFAETFDSGTLTRSSGSSVVITHNKGFIPQFNIICNNGSAYCSAITDTTITINYSATCILRVLCY